MPDGVPVNPDDSDGVTHLATWAQFEADASELAAEGRRLLYARGDGEGLLATVRGEGLPRIHPVNVAVVADGLFVFVMAKSAKRTDLEEDGRFALHSHHDLAAPSEFAIRGRARIVDGAVRSQVAAGWAFEIDETYTLFELSVDAALLGQRSVDEWPPRYRSWPPTA